MGPESVAAQILHALAPALALLLLFPAEVVTAVSQFVHNEDLLTLLLLRRKVPGSRTGRKRLSQLESSS
jgi:hypothetical protein